MNDHQRDFSLKTPTAVVIAAVVLSMAAIAIAVILTQRSDGPPTSGGCTQQQDGHVFCPVGP